MLLLHEPVFARPSSSVIYPVRERSVDISMALFPSVPLTTGKSKLFPLRVMIAFSDSLIKNTFRELGFYNPFKRVMCNKKMSAHTGADAAR